MKLSSYHLSEKLFKYFVNTYNPNSIISYCDFSKFRGVVYSNLGFDMYYQIDEDKFSFSLGGILDL